MPEAISSGRRNHFGAYLSKYWRRWAVLLAILWVLSVVLPLLLVPIQYESSTTVGIINDPKEGSESQFSFSVKLIESHNYAIHFASLYTHHDVLDLVREQMGWPNVSDEELIDMVNAVRDDMTVVVHITAHHRDAATASKLVTVYAACMAKVLTDVMPISRVETLLPASKPTAFSDRLLVISLCLLGSLAVAALLLWCCFLLNRRIGVQEDLRFYSFPILGEIPALPSAIREGGRGR